MGWVASQPRTFAAVVPKARRNRTDLLGWLIRRPQLLAATSCYEIALVTSARVPARLKARAELKAASLVTCEFCIDIGSALAELASAIAWENNRGRLNQALGVRPSGFAEGMVCAVPEIASS